MGSWRYFLDIYVIFGHVDNMTKISRTLLDNHSTLICSLQLQMIVDVFLPVKKRLDLM